MLFRHGAFTAGDAERTALALAILSAALPAPALTKILAPIFFAREDFRAPLIAMLAGLAVATVAAILLQPRLRRRPVSRQPSRLGAWISAGTLTAMLMSRGLLTLDRRALRRLLQVVIAAVVMGAVLWLTSPAWPRASTASSTSPRWSARSRR